MATAASPGLKNPPKVEAPQSAAEALAKKGDRYFFIGCLVCGTWVLGLPGAILLLIGVRLLRQAELAGAAIRPWSITLVGGLLLVDSSVNFMAWSLDLMPTHDTVVGRTLWIDFGRMVDGGYANYYNSTNIGGVSQPGEKAIQVASCFFVMPMKIAAAWYLLKMKRYGLQWSIIANWLYFCLWAVYVVIISMDFPLRFGSSEWGVFGLWMIGGIPFLGPIVILPFLYTVNKEIFTE